MPYLLDDFELGILVGVLNQPSAQTSPDPCISALLGKLEHAWHSSQMPFASTSELFWNKHLDADNVANLDADNAANLDADQASILVARHHGTYSDSDVDDNLSDSDNPNTGFQTLQKKRRHSVSPQGGNQRGIYFSQEERLEGGMELAGDGLGLWMEEMGGHGLGIDPGRMENEADLQDNRQDRGRSRIIAPRGNGLCGAERAAKRRRLAHVNENIVNGNTVNENVVNGHSVNETIASGSSVNTAGGNHDVAHENIASTVNRNAINTNASANAPRVHARARTPCRQGGQAPPQFLSGARRPVQLGHAERLMSSIVNASQNLESVNGQSRAAMDAFIRGTPWERGTDAFQTDSLYSLAQRCSQAEEVEKGVHFISMINTIQFRMKIEDMRVAHNYKNNRDILRDFLSDFKSVTLDTKQKWATQGSKFASLARAGSIYLLMLIATAGKKTLVTEMSGEVLGRLCMAIRNPDTNTPFGRQMVSDVIPAIDDLRRQFPVSFSTMFSAGALKTLSLPAQIKCHDLNESDRFFDCLPLNTFTSERCHGSWQPCLVPLSSQPTSLLPLHIMNRTLLNVGSTSTAYSDSRPPSPCTDIEDVSDDDGVDSPVPSSEKEFPLVIINTNYDRSHQDNKKFPLKRHYTDKSQAQKAGFIWTEQDRKKAMSAIIPKDMVSFQKRIKQVLQSGVRNARSKYTKYATSSHESQRVRINCKDGRNLAFIDSTLDQRLRDQLLDKFMALFPDGLKHTDTEEEGISNTFPSIHFVWYNRYATRGDGAPKDVHPDELYNGQGSRLNTAQFLPRLSKEAHENMQKYRELEEVFQEIWQYQRSVVEKYLPEEYEALRISVDLLPSNDMSPTYPFGGVVLNFNVSTLVHRDWKDLNVCLVMPISACQGGALVLHELGIVVECQSGDMVVFSSSEITHYNLHFKGLWASLVYHSDRTFKSYVDDRNGWGNHESFNGTNVATLPMLLETN